MFIGIWNFIFGIFQLYMLEVFSFHFLATNYTNLREFLNVQFNPTACWTEFISLFFVEKVNILILTGINLFLITAVSTAICYLNTIQDPIVPVPTSPPIFSGLLA
jgi:hypothetical protein